MKRALSLTLLVAALAAPVALAQKPMNFAVETSARNKGACEREAKNLVEDAKWQQLVKRGKVPSGFLACVRKSFPKLIETQRAGDVSFENGTCRVNYSGRYEESELDEATTYCVRTENPIPVGVLVRADMNDEAAALVARNTMAQLSETLERANFKIVNLNAFEAENQDLKVLSECAVTGAKGEADWNQRCKQSYGSLAEAREALAAKLRHSLKEMSKDDAVLAEWERCGGMVMIGNIKLHSNATDVRGSMEANYLSLVDLVSTIPPFSTDEMRRPISAGSADLAAREVVNVLNEYAQEDATQKLAKFADTRGCQSR